MTSSRTGLLFGIGVPLLVFALFYQTVTLVSEEYARVLITALVLTLLADICFIVAFRRGGRVAKVLSIILLLPTLFVMADFFRRAPHSF
jgi:hypothetical protein